MATHFSRIRACLPEFEEELPEVQDKPTLSAAACAFSALRREIVSFSFKDPYEADFSAALPSSIHYPVYSDRLTWECMRMDSSGIPRTWNRVTGVNYWPAYIAWYALIELGRYHRGEGPHHLSAFLKQLDWLERNAVLREDGAIVWQMNFDYPEDGIVLRSPWVSAHAQGLAISALVRGWRITRKPRLWVLLQRSAKIFDLDVRQGGVRTRIDGSTFYTEVPGGSVPGILDGFLVSLLGLHDLYVETRESNFERLLRDGIDGLRNLLPWWNYRNKWSWYGCRAYLCPPAYHFWNRILLRVIGELTGHADFKHVAEQWDPAHLSPMDRAEIYAAFLATKNAKRVRHRTWMQRTVR